MLQQARDIFHSRDDLWNPRETSLLVESASIPELASAQAGHRGRSIRGADSHGSQTRDAPHIFDAHMCACIGSHIISTRQLLSGVAWNAIGAGREAASIYSLPLREATDLLQALAKGGLRREDVPTPLMQSVCAALRDAMASLASRAPSNVGGERGPTHRPSQEQDRLLHVTHLSLELPGGPSNRTAVLAWVAQATQALHVLRVPPSFFDTLSGFHSDLLPFLEQSVNTRTEALQLLQGLGGDKDATAATAAALLGADRGANSGFTPLEVDAFIAACKVHEAAPAQQLEMLDAVAAASVARVRQGFVASADTAQLRGLAASLGRMYSDTTPPHLRHLAHMCAQQLYVRVGEWRSAVEGGGETPPAALHPRDACAILHSLTRVLRGSPHNYGVDTSHGHKVATVAAAEGWAEDAVANALRGQVSSTGHYHSISVGAPPSIKQLSKMPIDSASRVCAAVAQAAALAMHRGELPVPTALGAMGTLTALGEAHGSVASSTCSGQDVDTRSRGPGNGPVWKPWSRGKAAKAAEWPAATAEEARRLRAAGAAAHSDGGFRSDLARMLSASHFWWQDLFANGLSDAGPGKQKQTKSSAIKHTLKALSAEPTVAHAVTNVYTLVLFRALRLAVLDYRRIAKEYFHCAAGGSLPQTAIHSLTGGTESQVLSVRYAAERQWGPSAFGFSDEGGRRPHRLELGKPTHDVDGFSDSGSSAAASSDSEGWLFSDADDTAQDAEASSRFRLQYAPSDELRAARVDAGAAARVRHFDECMTAAHAWVLVDSMWLLKRQAQVASTVQSAAAFVDSTATGDESEDDNGIRAVLDLCLGRDTDVPHHIAQLLVGADMHQFRAAVIRMLELCAARLQSQTGQGNEGGADSKGKSMLASIKRILGPLRALHCRHTGQAAAASLRDAILQQHPAPASFYAATLGAGLVPAPKAVEDQASELLKYPPVVLAGGSSVEDATGGLLQSLFMLPPDALCGLAATLGTHEFNVHYGTVKLTPSRAVKRHDQLFGARVQRKRQTEAFRVTALEAQAAALRKAVRSS